MANPERDLHNAMADFLDLKLLRSTATWTTIGHGGYKLNIGAARGLKRMGLKAGWPDIIVIHDGRPIFLELKAPGSYPTERQRNVHVALREAGAAVEVIRSLDEADEFLTREGVF